MKRAVIQLLKPQLISGQKGKEVDHYNLAQNAIFLKSWISVLKGKKGFNQFYWFLWDALLQGKKGYDYNSYTNLEIITYHASKCIIHNLATNEDDSVETV